MNNITIADPVPFCFAGDRIVFTHGGRLHS